MTDTTTLDALAALRVQAGRGEPFRRHLQVDGVPPTIELPAPATTARALRLFRSHTLYRKGSTVVLADGTPPPWTLQDVAGSLVDTWAALPTRSDAARTYGDLRTLASGARGVALEYAHQVVRAWRDGLDPEPEREPEPAREKRERTPDVERKASSRERLRADEIEWSRWWLLGYLAGRWSADEAPPEPGSRVSPPVLHADAVREISTAVEEYRETLAAEPGPEPEYAPGDDVATYREAVREYEERLAARPSYEERVEEWEDYADDGALPYRPRVPGSRNFYGVADEVLGPRKRLRGSRVYTVPETPGGNMHKPDDTTAAFGEAVLDRIARLAWEERSADLDDYLAALVHERDGVEVEQAATGTDDAGVVDLDTRRRSR